LLILCPIHTFTADYIIMIRKEGFMMRKLFILLAVGVMLVFGSFAFATPAVNVVETPTNYFVPTDGQKYDAPYYRWYNEDWGWQHGTIASTFTTATLRISAFDIDAPSEVDNIYAYDSGTWVLLGSLAGGNDIWQYTDFGLGSNFFDDIATGLQVKIDIDSTNNYQVWAVTLAKSTLSLDAGSGPGPEPGPVPEPLTMLLLGLGLTGIAGARRFTK
jgi:hypothetical protein